MRLASSEEAAAQLAERTREVDAAVGDAFARHLEPVFPEGLALVAVGGYGRRELFPYSDVDLMVLLAKPATPALKEPLGAFLKDLWDAGLRMSHSAHTVEECAAMHEGNVELTISLLDRRPLAGDATLSEALAKAMPRFVAAHGAAIARELARVTRSRHAKSGNTIYHLEPNIKETPGGFRDVQVCRWLSALVPSRAVEDPTAAWRFLVPIRIFLHEAARRDANLLSFEMQDAISANPGEMMRNYYRHARTAFTQALEILDGVEQAQPSLMRQLRDWRARLSNSEFTVSRDRVFLRSPGSLAADPETAWRLLEFCARHGLPPSRDAERRLAAALPAIVAAAAKTPLWPRIRRILAMPHASAAVRVMHRTELLSALFPEWAHIDCLVVRDFYHRYTVDEHTIVTLENLEEIPDSRYRELATETEDMALVRFALLFHDAGKGTGREHSAESVRLVGEIAKRIGIPRAEAEVIASLIANHLVLSAATSSRDLDDDETGPLLAAQVETVERLKMLTLLTFADISAVNPTAMTPWRADQLWRTYLVGYRELTRELDTARIHTDTQEDSAAAFIEGFPERYRKTHTAEQIRAHVELAERVRTHSAAVELTRDNGYWHAVAAASDRPGLFASIAGTLAAFGMNILKAEAFANAQGMILDSFVFADPLRTLELNPSEVDRLRETLVRVILGKTDVVKLLAGRRQATRPPKQISPRVSFNNQASAAATLIEIVAEDRPGLLYDLSSTMSQAGCDIGVVLIDTEAHKALDVFYVTMNGAQIEGEKQAELKRALTAVCGA